MKKQLVNGLETLSTISVVLFILFGILAGAGAKGFGGAFLGGVIAFLFCIPIFGMLFLFLEMNESLREIRENTKK